MKSILLSLALGLAAPAFAAGPESAPCPSGLPADASCFSGRDEAGAWYWIALPAHWDHQVFVLHDHGGPELGAPKLERSAEDLQRWQVWLRAGYALAASTYHQGGVAVHAAAADSERLRRIFVERFSAPHTTLLHGQSWGASVAAVQASMYPKDYDGVLLTSGVLGGGPLSYDFRLDLRVIWQAVCANHPRADEPAYPLWQGLPPGDPLTRADLNKRVDECTGIGHPAAERSPAQQRRLKTVLDVIHIPERTLAGHLGWATWDFQDIVFTRLGGRNPFGNIGVRYRGSDDDDALNAKVARYRADPGARADFGADTDPDGRIAAPVLTLHAIDDPTAFVELESVFAATMARAGTADHLVQVFTDDHEHSYESDVEYIAAAHALLAWVATGTKPTPVSVAASCPALQAQWGADCRFRPNYRPAPLSARVPPRQPD